MSVNAKTYRGFRVLKGDDTGEQLGILLPTDYRVLHIASAADEDTDWNIANPDSPTVYVHSETTPETEYGQLSHNATDFLIESVGGGILLTPVGGVAIANGATKLTLGTVSTFGTTQPTNTLVLREGTAPVGAITTAVWLFSSATVVRKIIADGTASNVET